MIKVEGVKLEIRMQYIDRDGSRRMFASSPLSY